MPHIGPFEATIIVVIVLIIFGAGKLPEIGGAIGRGIREFRKGQTGEGESLPPSKGEGKEKQVAPPEHHETQE